ncbi:unnamed protein product [Protopolystoma xenopodis]|uniref:Uncharacterized protein n=1 Tax=Protopolystoma xenopodis TaxID=117903 RepID=A0A3S5CIF5_9PLAT|nr:unnamed protein product [Protopolystoma xenopodis]
MLQSEHSGSHAYSEYQVATIPPSDAADLPASRSPFKSDVLHSPSSASSFASFCDIEHNRNHLELAFPNLGAPYASAFASMSTPASASLSAPASSAISQVGVFFQQVVSETQLDWPLTVREEMNPRIESDLADSSSFSPNINTMQVPSTVGSLEHGKHAGVVCGGEANADSDRLIEKHFIKGWTEPSLRDMHSFGNNRPANDVGNESLVEGIHDGPQLSGLFHSKSAILAGKTPRDVVIPTEDNRSTVYRKSGTGQAFYRDRRIREETNQRLVEVAKQQNTVGSLETNADAGLMSKCQLDFEVSKIQINLLQLNNTILCCTI